MAYNAEVQTDTESDIGGSEKKSKEPDPKGSTNKKNFPEGSVDVKQKKAQSTGNRQNGRSINPNVYYNDDDMCIDAAGGLKVGLKIKPRKKIKVISKSKFNDDSSLFEDQGVKCFIDVPDFSLVGIDGGYQDPF
nr:unnamed protein product [Callosobruchus analis]